jgi:branched-chain amino acid transport system permease protein
MGSRRSGPLRRRAEQLGPLGLLVLVAALPFALTPASAFLDDTTQALAYTVMALGLNIIVGFAGLLDLGYVVFFAVGAYTVGWFASDFLADVAGGRGIHIWVEGAAAELPGIHANYLLVALAAAVLAAGVGMLIGLPTLRLRGDYIAIVTLAFGEIIGRLAVIGDEVRLAGLPLLGGPLEAAVGPDQTLTAGRFGITPVDKIQLPGVERFGSLDLRPWFWAALGLVVLALLVNLRLRDSRPGRAWMALREDEVAAVAMGVAALRTKLLAYGLGAAFGGVAGAFLGSYYNTVSADQFEVQFSIVILAMVILGGTGSAWGVVAGALTLTYINTWLLPDVLNRLPERLGLDVDVTRVDFAIYGYLLVMMMIFRPQGLLPERGRRSPVG